MPPPYDRNNLPTVAEWKAATALNVLHRRSDTLRQVDDALAACEGQHPPTDTAFRCVQSTFERWKLTEEGHDAWRLSPRNHSWMLTRLDQLLSGQEDTDQALGVPAFMEPGMEDARRGVLYLFSNLQCNDTAFRVVLHSGFDIGSDVLFSKAKLPVDLDSGPLAAAATKFTRSGASEAPKAGKATKEPARTQGAQGPVTLRSDQFRRKGAPPPPAETTLWESIKNALISLGRDVVANLQEEWARMRNLSKGVHDDKGLDAWSSIVEDVTLLCDALARSLLSKGFKPLGSVVETGKGIYLAGSAAVAKYNEWRRSQNVEVLAGYPSTVQEAIRHAMWMSIGNGVYETLKGGLKLGLDFAAAAAGEMVALLIGAVEAIVKCVLRLVDLHRIKTFLAEARNYWTAKAEDNGLHKHPIEFNLWFKPYALAVPSLAALVLNSGVCQDSMRFLKVISADNTVITQSAYDAGLVYIDELKLAGARLLEEEGYSFSSEDKVLQFFLEKCTTPSLAVLSPRSPLKAILDTVASS